MKAISWRIIYWVRDTFTSGTYYSDAKFCIMLERTGRK